MKKVLSFILAVTMVAGLFAINVNAAVSMQASHDLMRVYYRDGESTSTGFATTQNTVAGGTSVNIVDDGSGNNALEFAFNGTGAFEGTRLYALHAIPSSHMVTSWDNISNYSIEMDIKAVNNTSGIGMSLHKTGKTVNIFPSALSTESWTTVKVEVVAGIVSVFAKAQGEPDEAYERLVSGTDYFQDVWPISSSTTFILLDTSIMNVNKNINKYDSDNFKTAKYLVDNIEINKIDLTEYKKNFLYYDTSAVYTFETSKGASGLEHKLESAIEIPDNSFVWVFDAVKTGGERPVNVNFAPNNSVNYSINIINAPQNVKYTYKADYEKGVLKSFSRKAEGTTVFETLKPGTDYSPGYVYGAWTYFKFGYLGEYYKDNATQLEKYCGTNPALEDVNTVWKFSNFQITGKDAGVSPIVYKKENGHQVAVSAVAGTTDFNVIAAVFEGSRIVTSGMAEINHEGTVFINLIHDVANPTIKLFIWDKATAKPLIEEWDITDMVQYPPDEEEPPVSDDIPTDLIPGQNGYDGEFYVDWSKPETYSNWRITDAPELKINETPGVLTLDVQNVASSYEVKYRPIAPENYDFEFRMKVEDFGTKDFGFKVTNDNYNNYQYVAPDRIFMVNREHAQSGGMGLFANIDNEWHDWKVELRGEYCTLYMDGGELYRFRQGSWQGEKALIHFTLGSTLNDVYKIHLGRMHYRPYFPTAELTSPANGAEFTEDSDITFKASADSSVSSVDYYINGLKVGSGTGTDYAFTMATPTVGTYRVCAAVNGVKGPESVITVSDAYATTINPASTSFSYGNSVKLSFDNAKVSDISKIEIYANDEYKGNATTTGILSWKSFTYTLSGLPVGTSQVYAKVYPMSGTPYMTPIVNIEVTSTGNATVNLKREYEIDYTYSGGTANLNVADGYFGLDLQHVGNKIIYQSNEGQKEYSLGSGKFKLVVTSGLVDLYYNGHFAHSWFMPRTSTANTVTHSGIEGFIIGGSGVKTEYYSKAWTNDANFSDTVRDVPSNYSIEFDKTDASDESIVFYDGEYKVWLDIKDGVMTSSYHDVETGEQKPYTLLGEAKPGYWRITVAKGLAQVWIDNIYVDSFSAEAIAHTPEIVRTMANPSASTIIAIKGTDDLYYHKEDFSGSGEMAPLDYWIEDTDAVTATVSNSSMKIAGTGDVYLNGQSDDVHMKWSAKIESGNNFYVTPRVFRGPYYNVKAGYNYTTGKWYIKSYSKDTRYPADGIREWSGTVPSLNTWHEFELIIKDESLILKMDGKNVINAGVYMPFWGYTGFGIEGGSVLIDNVDYIGKCKVTAGIKSAIIGDEVGIAEFYQLNDGTVVYENSWTKKMTTKDGGLTWSEPVQSMRKDNTGILNLQDGRLFRLEHKDTSNIIAYVSANNGVTWGRMGDLNSCRPAARRVVLNGSVTQASTGRIFVACDETFTEANSITGLYYTDDCGKTWFEAESAMGIPTSMGISTETTGFNFQEGTMTELPDGTIRYTARTGMGFVYYMDSHDGGKNYGEFRPTQFINPLCTYAFERDNQDPDTYYAIIEYDATTYCYRYIHSPRNRFALMVSYDGCKTWEFAMTLNEWGEFPLFDACNHVIRVFDDTIYVNWNNLDAPRRSFVYAIDKSKLRTTKRFEEVHERTFRGAMSSETGAKQVVLPKTSGNASIYGQIENITVSNGMYAPETVAKVFGAKASVSGSKVTFTLGNAKVIFTEGAKSVDVNGTAVVFDEAPMNSGYLDITACGKVFGKNITEAENAYVLWYGAPLVDQYMDDYVDYL